MRNLLEPGNRRNNWLEKEESGTSWYEDAIQMFIQSMKEQLETMRQNYKPDGKWYDPYPLDSSDLELDEDPDFIPESDDPDWEGHYYPEDPVEFGHFDAENETFSEYLKRMGQ